MAPLPPRHCARYECGKEFQPKIHNHRYCCRECKRLATGLRKLAEFKERNPEYWQKYREKRKLQNRKKPPEMAIPYNPKPCLLCKQPLGKTLNYYYCPDCHKRVSHVLDGIEVHTLGYWHWRTRI